MTHCNHCKKEVELRKTKKHKSNAAYHFTHYYYCVSCKKMYMSEEFKVSNDGVQDTKRELKKKLKMDKATVNFLKDTRQRINNLLEKYE